MPSGAGVPQGSAFSLLVLASTPLEKLHNPSLSPLVSSPLLSSLFLSPLI